AAGVQTLAADVAVRGWPAPRVPFADVAGLVAGIVHHAGPVGHIGFRAEAEIIVAVLAAVAAGQQFGPAGHTDRAGRDRPRERRPLVNQPIEVRRADDLVP